MPLSVTVPRKIAIDAFAHLARFRHRNRKDREGLGHHKAFWERREYRMYLQDSKKPCDVRERARFADFGDGSGLARCSKTSGNGIHGAQERDSKVVIGPIRGAPSL